MVQSAILKGRLFSAALFTSILLAVFASYSNHFDNEFHFDDSHTVVKNPYMRDIHNVPLFFADAATFSVQPLNRSYRPVTSASIALDYWMSGGLKPRLFHVSTFVWFCVQLWLMHVLFTSLLSKSIPEPRTRILLSAFAVAWYGLHPVAAETVNYVIQRADLFSALAVISGLIMYIKYPRARQWGFYLIPVAIGALAKPPAIMFAPILFLYLLLIELEGTLRFWEVSFEWKKVAAAMRGSLPAFIFCGALYLLITRMEAGKFSPGGTSLYHYLITQPFIFFHYVCSIILPIDLTVDTDLVLLPRITDVRALLGLSFLAAMINLMLSWSRSAALRPAAFGLGWFFLALVPTTVVPLAEVANDHRMFFPLVGLLFAIVVYAHHWALSKSAHLIHARTFCTAGAALCCAILPLYAYGTYQRNKVWSTDEALWRDAATKSPRNGRALMNYGLALMRRGDYVGAQEYFLRALPLTPNYYSLEINLGIVSGHLKNDLRARAHFQRAISLAPNQATPYYFFARWLHTVNKIEESLQNLDKAIANVPQDVEPRYLKMKILREQERWQEVKAAALETLAYFPSDAVALALRDEANNALTRNP